MLGSGYTAVRYLLASFRRVRSTGALLATEVQALRVCAATVHSHALRDLPELTSPSPWLLSPFARRTTKESLAAPIALPPTSKQLYFVYSHVLALHSLGALISRPSSMAEAATADPLNVTSTLSSHPSSMAVDRLSADLATMEVNARQPNFPIPRELRDMIYMYLLDSNYTRVRRTYDQIPHDRQSGPKAYHFHTNILAVNHEIHAEAEDTLYKHNTFVVVSYQWHSFEFTRGSLAWAPIVSNKNTARMTNHSLRIHADPGPTALRVVAHQILTGVPIKSYIILAGDINAFCLTMHDPEHSDNGAAITISTFQGAEPQLDIVGLNVNGVLDEPIRIKCQLRDTKYRKMDRALQNHMLARLASIKGKSQKVRFTGAICNFQQVEHLKKVMGPSLLCQNAVYWSVYEECELAKEVADAAVAYDETEYVVHLYRTLSHVMWNKLGSFIRSDQVRLHNPTFKKMIKAMDTFTMEVLLNVALGELKLRQIGHFEATWNKIKEVVSHHTRVNGGRYTAFAPGMTDRYCTVAMYAYLYIPQLEGEVRKFGTGPISWFAKRFFFQDVLNIGPYQVYDYQVLARHADQEAVMSPDHLPLDECAAVRLPFAPTSFYKTVEGAMQTGHYDGWHDVDFLRSLRPDIKRRIRAMQLSYVLERTDFTQL